MEGKTIYALGFFDGVHLGHAALLKTSRALAAEHGCAFGAVTFSAHPDGLVLGKAPGLINTAGDRKMLMETLFGTDRVVELPFDRDMMAMGWKTFLLLLRRRYGAAGFVCGHDFRFGKGGEGDGQRLSAFCREAGMPFAVVPEQKLDGVTVSSSYIRTLLEAGDMERAAAFLGHPHVLTGTVVPGRHLGRTLGIPTANLVLPEGLLCPRKGVYACRAKTEDGVFPAVTNVGVRPTVDGAGLTVEAWLLGYAGELYGRPLTLEFHKFLRPEKKFPDLSALQAEIEKNAGETLEFFGKR